MGSIRTAIVVNNPLMIKYSKMPDITKEVGKLIVDGESVRSVMWKFIFNYFETTFLLDEDGLFNLWDYILTLPVGETPNPMKAELTPEKIRFLNYMYDGFEDIRLIIELYWENVDRNRDDLEGYYSDLKCYNSTILDLMKIIKDLLNSTQ